MVFVLIKTYENISYTVTAWYQRNEAKPMKMKIKIAKETMLDYVKGYTTHNAHTVYGRNHCNLDNSQMLVISSEPVLQLTSLSMVTGIIQFLLSLDARLWFACIGSVLCVITCIKNCSFNQLCYCFWKSVRFNRMKLRLMCHMCTTHSVHVVYTYAKI